MMPSSSQLEPEPFTFVELFAGVGGFRIGCEAVNGTSVWATEIDRAAKATYHANFRQVPYHDITRVDTKYIPDHDLLTAGFPCQDFSNAGGIGKQEGLEGSRGALFWEVVRVLKDKMPKAFLLENVKGLCTMEDGKVFKIVLDSLTELGYTVSHGMINSSCLVPQYVHWNNTSAAAPVFTSWLRTLTTIHFVFSLFFFSSSLLLLFSPRFSSFLPRRYRNRVYIVGFLDAAAAARFVFPAAPALFPPRDVADVFIDVELDEEGPFVETFRLKKEQWESVKEGKVRSRQGGRARARHWEFCGIV